MNIKHDIQTEGRFNSPIVETSTVKKTFMFRAIVRWNALQVILFNLILKNDLKGW